MDFHLLSNLVSIELDGATRWVVNDLRYCFIEADVSALDGSGRRW